MMDWMKTLCEEKKGGGRSGSSRKKQGGGGEGGGEGGADPQQQGGGGGEAGGNLDQPRLSRICNRGGGPKPPSQQQQGGGGSGSDTSSTAPSFAQPKKKRRGGKPTAQKKCEASKCAGVDDDQSDGEVKRKAAGAVSAQTLRCNLPRTETSGLRRSSRSRRHTNPDPSCTSMTMSKAWQQQCRDIDQCKLKMCTTRLQEAGPEQVRELKLSGLTFVAMAVARASAKGGSREGRLIDYARTVLEMGLDPNDSHKNDTAVVLAARHGYNRLLALLLEAGCSIKNCLSTSSCRSPNALHAAVSNGQRSAVELLLALRSAEVLEVVRDEPRHNKSSLFAAAILGDTETARLLKSHDCVFVTDGSVRWVKLKAERVRLYQEFLQGMHPDVPNVMCWSKELHWSFPQTDRETLNWLWKAIHRPSAPHMLPSELWLRIFGMVGRGWWAKL